MGRTHYLFYKMVFKALELKVVRRLNNMAKFEEEKVINALHPEKAEEILQTKGSMTFCAKGCGYTV